MPQVKVSDEFDHWKNLLRSQTGHFERVLAVLYQAKDHSEDVAFESKGREFYTLF